MTDVGMTIRAARAAARLSQRDLAARCGYSQSWLSRVESGRRVASDDDLRRIARELGIDATWLGVAAKEGDVRRRQLIGAAGAAVASVLPTGAAATASETDALLMPPDPVSRPPHPQVVEVALEAAVRRQAAAQYREVAADLPRLVGAVTQLDSDSRAAQCLRARVYVLATAVLVKTRHEAAVVMADRAMAAARRSQHPLATAQAARAFLIAWRQRGEHTLARNVASRAVAELAGEELARPVVGHILLEASYGAAQCGQEADAEDLWHRAGEMATRTSRLAWPDHAGPLSSDQVARYGMCVQHLLGHPSAAMRHRASIRGQVPTAERQARIHHDTAKLHKDLGDYDGALTALVAHESVAPQDARRASVRRMVADMVTAAPHQPRLRRFAAHIGAV